MSIIVQVRIENVELGMVAQNNVVSATEGILIARKGAVLNAHMIEKLREHGVGHVAVDVADGYLNQHPGIGSTKAEKLADYDLPPYLDAELPDIKPLIDEKLREEAVGSIRNMFSIANASKTAENLTTAYMAVKEVNDVVDKLVDTLSEEERSFVHIADLKSYDEYTYHHSLSVAVLSIAIGQSIGLHEDEIRQLGRCAMLHDIGKMFVPAYIINKPQKLSDEEFEIAKKHSLYSYECLEKWGIGDKALWHGALCHHEKIDGSGYPMRLKGDKIPLCGRIISVADVYDAVTSYRSYRSPMPPAEAIELIMGQAGTAFDYEIVQAFVDKIELYPINACVELSNKRFGIVINNAHTMRPVLRMIDNGETVDLMGLNNLNLVIVRVVKKKIA